MSPLGLPSGMLSVPEHLRALVAVLFLGGGFFWAVRPAAVQWVSDATFLRWRNVWLLSTLILFLSNSIWICILLYAALYLTYRRKEVHLLGLYFAVLFVAPYIPAVIPGFGILDHFWEINHYRLLGVTLLLPAAIALFLRASTPRMGSSPVDWMVLGYVILMSALAFRDASVTGALRSAFSVCIDILLPYYVASRSIRESEDLRHALAGYVLAAMILSLLTVFEVARTWKLYGGLLSVLGVNEQLFGFYLFRSGLLRPNVTLGNSIVLGYVMVVGLGFFLYLHAFLIKPFHRRLGFFVLIAGIVASLSRGPWVGAACLILVFIFMGPQPFRHLARMVLGSVVVLLLINLLPMGRLLIDMLPFVGSLEQGNVEYRANLLTVALPVIERNLLFGSPNFLEAPEMQVMLQGEGIIDVVNTYIGVALYSGVVGLMFFLGAFCLALLQLRAGMRIARRHDARDVVLGRALFATVASIMLMIYTVSSIFAVPVVYWPVIGLCVAYAGAMKAHARKLKEGS